MATGSVRAVGVRIKCGGAVVKVFLDMDGVLADFVDAAHKVHGRTGSFDDPKNRGIFDIERIWGISPEQFWAPIDAAEGFWEGLNKTPEADEIVTLAEEMVGSGNVAILSAPHLSPACIPGKYAWLNANYPQFKKRIIFGSAKEFLAGPNRILVDDRDKNIWDFTKAGGYGVLVPRLWNAEHYREDVMGRIREQFTQIGDERRGM